MFLVALAMFAVFDLNSQREQAESAMLEEARTFAREMDAVWQFMDNSQNKINYTSDGTYEFKGSTARWWARVLSYFFCRKRLCHARI